MEVFIQILPTTLHKNISLLSSLPPPPDPHPTPAKSAELEVTHCKSEDLKPPYDIHNCFSKDRNKNRKEQCEDTSMNK